VCFVREQGKRIGEEDEEEERGEERIL